MCFPGAWRLLYYVDDLVETNACFNIVSIAER